MKRLLTLLLLIPVLLFGQQPNNTNTNFTNGLGSSKFFNIPRGTTPPTTGILSGSLFYHTTNGLQYYDGATWQTLGVSGGSVTSFNGRSGVVVPLIGDYSGFFAPLTRTLTVNSVAYDLSANRSWSVGTVTSVAATAGTGISVSGSPITTSGTLTVTNTAPDQTVVLNNGSGIDVTGTYPNFTITNTGSPSSGTVTSVSGNYPLSVSSPTTTPIISIPDGTIANAKLTNSTISGKALGTDLATLTLGNGLTGGSYNGSATTTARADTSVVQTVDNFFPKGDTRYLKGDGTANFVPYYTAARTLAVSPIKVNEDSLTVGNTAGTGGTSLYGKVYLKNVSLGLVSDSILVVRNGRIFKVLKTNGTVTSVAALTLGTSGTDLSSTVATGTTTPVITLNVPTSSAANRGALSAADWTTFNNKTSNTGTVTSVSGTSPISVATGTTTPVISMTAASAANDGYVTTGTQTIAGAKTFNSTIVGSVNGNSATVTTNANLTGAVTSVGNATSLGSFTSANLSTALTDETGTGNAVFSVSPALTGTVTGAAANFSGNVGVGTASPSSKLTVSDTGGTTYGSSDQLRVTSGTSGNRSEIHLTDGVTSDGYVSFLPSATAATRFVEISANGSGGGIKVYGNGNLDVVSLAGSGDVIAYSNNSGVVGKAAIGSGLSFSSGTLSATGGAAGTITGSGTAGKIAKFNSSSDIGDASSLTISGSDLQVAGVVQGTTLTSTVATGTAPLTVTSTTPVTNLSIGGSAATLTTNRAIWGQNFNGSSAVSGAIIGATTIDASSDVTVGGSLLLGSTTPAVNGTGIFKIIKSNSATNWQISTNNTLSGALELTPSTAEGGSTFTTPVMYLTPTSIVANQAITGALTGNASTATALQTARTISGTSFDGTANITLNNSGITNGAAYITSSALSGYAPLASPSLTGTPTAPTQTAGDNSTKIATTAYVDTKFASTSNRQLKDWYADANNVSTTSTDLMTYTVPGNTLVNNGDKLSFRFSGIYAANANSKTLEINFAGTAWSNFPYAVSGGSWVIFGTIIKTGATTYRINISEQNVNTSRAASSTAGTVTNFTGTNVFKLAATGGASSDITAQMGTLEFKPAAL